MNLQMQIFSFILILILLVVYTRQKKLYLNTERFFMTETCLVLLCLSLDILSVIVFRQRNDLPGILVEMVYKFYLISLIYVLLCGLFYICVDIYWKKEDYMNIFIWHGTATIAASLIILFLPLSYYTKDGGVCTYGLCVYATYVVSFCIWGITMFRICRHRSRINPERRSTVALWLSIWFVAAILQILFRNLSLISFTGVLGVMILYIKSENPQMNISRRTGLFNHNAFIEYVRQQFGQGENFASLSITFANSFEGFLQTEEGEQKGWQDIRYLLSIPEAKVFRRTEDEVTIIFKQEETARKWTDILMEKFAPDPCRMGLDRTRWVLIPNVSKIRNAEDYFHLIKYIAKENPENDEDILVYVEDSVIEQMYHERDIEFLLEEALAKDRVEVFYQPIYSIKEGCFSAAEALVRIRNEEGGIVSPGEFIPVAEKTGKILKLGECVFEKVCHFIREHHIEQYGVRYIEVNLSVVQCADATLSDTYISIMEKHGVLPRYINLEITESASLSDKEVLLANMRNLMNYGVNFSLDDFGTGQSNLNYIVDMPVDIVKFDRDMTSAYFDNNKAKYVMDAAMHMIHGMGLEIVSEGIETKHQYQAMAELGISYIQGYYFSKPLPANEFLSFVSNAHNMNC